MQDNYLDTLTKTKTSTQLTVGISLMVAVSITAVSITAGMLAFAGLGVKSISSNSLHTTKFFTAKTDTRFIENLYFKDPKIIEDNKPFVLAGNLTREEVLESQKKFDGYIIKFSGKSQSEVEKEYYDSKNISSSLKNKLSKLSSAQTVELKRLKDKVLQSHQTITTKIEGKISAYKKIPSSQVKKEITGKKWNKFYLGMSVRNIDTSELEQLKKEIPEIESYSPNYIFSTTLMDSVPLIGADRAWQIDENLQPCQDNQQSCITGKGIKVAVIDTGIDYTHSDFADPVSGVRCLQTNNINEGSCPKVRGGYDFVNNDNDPMDDAGHGTHVAGIISAQGILKGVAPDANIYSYKVCSQYGGCPQDYILSALEKAENPDGNEATVDRVDVINLSLGGYGWSNDPISSAVNHASDSGIAVVVSAGNSGPYGSGDCWQGYDGKTQSICSPGVAEHAITVGASYKKNYSEKLWGNTNPLVDTVTGFSSRGPSNLYEKNEMIIKPDILAPGAIICSSRYDSIFPTGSNPVYMPCLDEEHLQLAGTSMASPVIAGVVALIKQKNPEWDPSTIKTVLKNTAKDVHEPINAQGAGRVDALVALQYTTKPPVANITNVGFNVNFQIFGVAQAENFKEYVISFAHGFSGDSFTEIYRSSKEISLDANILFDDFFDIALFNEGWNVFKLQAIDNEEKFSIDYYPVYSDYISIVKPYADEVRRVGDIVDVTASRISYDGLGETLSYAVEYGIGENPTEWKSNGITLMYPQGIQEFIDDTNPKRIAIFDTKIFSQYTTMSIRVNVVVHGRPHYEYIKNIRIDPALKLGWPVDVRGRRFETGASANAPLIADLDNNGSKEVIWRGAHHVFAYNADGTPFNSNWPQERGCGWYSSGYITPPAVGDIDGDGENEVVTADTGVWGLIDDGGLSCEYCAYAWNLDGTPVNGWPLTCDQYREDDVPSLSEGGAILSDLDGDGSMEAIFSYRGAYNKYPPATHVVSGNGTPFRNFPYIFQPFGKYKPVFAFGPVSVGDVDCDNEKEIVGVLETEVDGTQWLRWKFLYILSSQGSLESMTELGYGDSTNYNPILINLDNDCNLEIMAKNNSRESNILDYNDQSKKYLIKSSKYFDRQKNSHPSAGRIFGDKLGFIEVGLRSYGLNSGNITLMESSLNTLWEQEVAKINWAPPILADINNDKLGEIFFTGIDFDDVSVNGMLYAFEHDGANQANPLAGFPKQFSLPSNSGVAIDDLDNNNKTDIIAADDLHMYVWELDFPYNAEGMEWPQFMHDAQHTGFYEIPKKPASRFLRGDVNNDGKVDISDPVRLLDYLFKAGDDISCQDAGDANDDGELDISDAIKILLYLSDSQKVPNLPPPFGALGVDPTLDELKCDL